MTGYIFREIIKGVENLGTGFFISSDGYAITCKHVIEDEPNQIAILTDLNEYPIGVIATSERHDLALILVATSRKTPFLSPLYPLNLSSGEPVLAIGSSIDLHSTVTEGTFSGIREPLDLNILPALKWDTIPLEPYLKVPGAIGVETKRGCILQCDYCTYPFLDGPKIRKHPLENVVLTLEDLALNHGFSQFTFVDSVLNIPIDHAQQICQQMVQKKIPLQWVGWFNEKKVKKSVLLEIADNGPGIPGNKIKDIFNPYYTTKREGFGVGLTISRRNIESHGGHIEVESSVGVGTKFAIYIPAKFNE